MTKHTKGKWEVATDGNTNLVFSQFKEKTTIISEQEDRANARLICQAPAMYTTLKEVQYYSNALGEMRCAWCDSFYSMKHKDSCKLNNLLTEIEGEDDKQ